MEISKVVTSEPNSRNSKPIEPAKQIEPMGRDAKEKQKAVETAQVQRNQKADRQVQSREELKSQMEQINEFLSSIDMSAQFSIHEGSGRVFFRLVQDQTGEVIRQFPPDELLELAARLKDMADSLLYQEDKILGVLVDHKQ